MKYKITIKTGFKSGSGTDAKVSFKLFGSNAYTKEITLESKINQFEKGSTDTFYFESTNLGNIEKIKIWHNNKWLGANWFLQEIIIKTQNKKRKWYFPIHKWITKNNSVTVKSVPFSMYHFEITTGTLPGSGTSENIQISIIGSKSYTPFIDLNHNLRNSEFRTGHTNNFSMLLENLGKIEEIKLKSDITAFNSNWFLNKIKIKKETEKNFTIFLFNNWIKPNQIHTSTKNLIEYTIKFYTGNVASGGTDANISIIIYGTRGETKPIQLNELIARNAFEAGQIDFVKITHKNLGRIKKVRIWHDQKWLNDGWFLNKISIKNNNTGIEVEFPYYSWLDKSADPNSTKIELTRIPIQPRPFYAIAHMVNTPAYVEEALELGSNAVEFDVTPKLERNNNFSFDVFHGFRPDFDPDKINLMERSIARTDLNTFLQDLKLFENKYKKLALVIYDCKLDDVPRNKLETCGIQLTHYIINNFYSTETNNRIFTVISIGKKKYTPFFDGIIKTLSEKLKQYFGFDLSEEKFQITEKAFEQRKEANFWWGSGIASTVPKPLKHFIPQFLIAAKKRTKRGIIKKIYYWTLDDPDSMARILVTKLDGIIVNDPLKLLKVLEKEEFRYTYRLATRNDNPFNVF